MSRLNPRLFSTHPVTRSALAEALVSKLALLTLDTILDRYQDVVITKSDLFKWLLQYDPLVSIISYSDAWDGFAKLPSRYSVRSIHNGAEPTLRIQTGDVASVVGSISSDIKCGLYQRLDEQDPNLQHLFAANEEPPRPETLPRMDIHGRLLTSADDKLDQLIKILEPISGFMQRAFEEQSIAAVVARQNQLALEDIEKKIEQLSAAQQPAQFAQMKEMTMAERITKAATETGTGVLSAIQEGGKISLSQKANQGVVDLFHKHLGHHIPGATSPVGKKIEAIAIPAILHFGAAAFSDKIPHVDVVQRACLRAITGESKDGMDGMLEVLMPIFREIVASEGIVGEAMKEMARTEVAKIEQAPTMPQLSAHDIQAQALMDSFIEQVKNAKPGEPVEIRLTLPARTEEPRSLVPPFEK